MKIKSFPLQHFDEIVPVLMRCFPDFWQERLGRNERSFPYELELFTAETETQTIGTVGIHGYDFYCCDDKGEYFPVRTGSLSDVGVVPEMRSCGYAAAMQKFVIDLLQHDPGKMPMIPLYTDKPPVYMRQGWQEYLPDNSREIRTSDFTGKKDKIKPDLQQVMDIYFAGNTFPGKVIRKKKTFLELISDPTKSWRIEDNTYFLYAGERLIEAYSADPNHPVNLFTPVNGGHDDNKVMLNLINTTTQSPEWQALQNHIHNRTLQFPIADVF